MLWILALAKARSAAPISAVISAKRATQASAKINATLEGARQKGSWLRRSFVPARCGDAPHSLLAIRPSASTRDPLQYFNSLLWRNPNRIAERGPIADPCLELVASANWTDSGRRSGQNKVARGKRD